MSQVVREGDLRVWLVHISPLLGIDGRQLLKLLYYGKPLTWNKLGGSVSTPVDIYSQIAPQLMSNEQFLSTMIHHLSLLGSDLGGARCIEALKQFKNLPSYDVVLETYSNGMCTCPEAELMEHLVKAYVFLDARKRKSLLKHLSETHLPMHSDHATVFEVFSKLFQGDVVKVKKEQSAFLSALEKVRASMDAFGAIHSYLDKYQISYSVPVNSGGGLTSMITNLDEDEDGYDDTDLLVREVPPKKIEKKPCYCRPTTYIIFAVIIFITGTILFCVAALVVHFNSYMPLAKSYDREATCDTTFLPVTPVRLATLDSSLWIQSLSIEQNTSHGYHFQDIKYYLVPDEDLKVREEKINHNCYYNGSTIWRLYFPYWYCLKGSYISFNSCLIAVDDSLGLSNLSLFTRYYNYEGQVEDHPYVTWKNFTLIVNGSEANLNCTTHEFIVPFDTFIFFRYDEPVNAALMFNITGMRWYLNATDLSNITAFGSSFSDDYPKVEKQFVTFPPKKHEYYLIAIVEPSPCQHLKSGHVILHTTIYPNKTGIYFILLISIIGPFLISALVPLVIAMYFKMWKKQ